jgi:glycosyltransferase involved in cell wall biosynthesis
MSDIAVVIPCFNLGRFVEEAVRSVLGQTRAAAEVVVVDDGSTDPTTRQVLASMHPPGVRIVRTENRGVSAARNWGIRLTSAKYLVTLDADDRLSPDYLAQTSARLDADPELGFVSTAIQTFGETAYTWTPPEPSVASALVRGAPHPASMFRREVWDAVGGFDESALVQGCEDLDFWVSAMEHAYRGAVIPQALLEYRVRNDSVHQRLVFGGGQHGVMAAVFKKHRRTIESIGPELLTEKERFIVEQRAYRAGLIVRRDELALEQQDLETEFGRLEAVLARQGCWGLVEGWPPLDNPVAARPVTSVDTFYVRSFLAQYSSDIAGRVLRVEGSSHPTPDEPADTGSNGQEIATRHRTVRAADLATEPSESVDCVISVDAVRSVYDVRGVVAEMHRILAQGGVLLCALHAVHSRLDDAGTVSDYWRFTEASARKIFAEVFPPASFSVQVYGNVRACTAALTGADVSRLHATERDTVDPMFPVVYGVRGVRPGSSRRS